jgi:hypothetical protein
LPLVQQNLQFHRPEQSMLPALTSFDRFHRFCPLFPHFSLKSGQSEQRTPGLNS